MAFIKRVGRIALTVTEWIGVVVFALLALVIATVGIVLAWVGDPPQRMGEGVASAAAARPVPAEVAAARKRPPVSPDEAASLFAPVYEVLVSPRCMNCHPAGDRPLSDRDGVHPMNISRESFETGLQCSACHADHNADLPGAPPGPPGAPHWQLPPKETPMVFQDRTVTALCVQLRDLTQNGNRTLQGLLEHVSKDPLVLWGWSPGAGRAPAPSTHEAFVKSFTAWVNAGGICPGETVAPDLSPPSKP
jgi:mono/diheme cytochrome c family protein